MASQFRLQNALIDFRVGAALLLSILCSYPVRGQVVGGTISGTISDKSGAVVVNATVSLKNLATGVSTAVKTNAQGLYSMPNLLPGDYQQSVAAAGFEISIRNGIILTVGAQLVSNIEMKVGTINESVVVSDLPPDLQLESSSLSSSINSQTIVELPLNARSWTDLATLQPGVNTIRNMAAVSSTDRLGRGYGLELSVSGGRPQQNNYLLDGISINDYTNQAPGSILGGNLGVDAVAEFSVLTTNQGAEYGRTSGGVISAINRSGTNRLHGSAYEFLRNSALDARNFFDGPIPPFRRNQFGVSAGGPIRKDKTFIFADYEGLRQSLGLSMVDNVPSLTARGGMLCNPPDCTTFTNVGVDPLVAPYLQFYPLPQPNTNICPYPTCPTGGGDTAIFTFGGSQITTENFFTTRVDHKFSEKDNLAGSYMYDNSPSSQNDEFNNKLIFTKTRRQLVSMEENHSFRPTLINSIRLGYHREYAAAPSGSKAINPLAADISLGYVPGDTVGFIGVPGLTFFTGGLSTQTPAEYNWNSWQVYDNVFLTKGKHSLKFGANVERIIDNQTTPSQPGGDFEFSSLADFLTNNQISPTDSLTLIGDAPGLPSRRRVRETVFGAYLQDDMHVSPNLTANLGLRYEIATVPSETSGRLASLQHLTDPTVIVHSPLYSNPTLRNFEPRIGFAWDPFGNAKTAVRGGFGMFDVQTFPANLRHTIDGTVPFYASVNGTVPAGSFGPFSLVPTPPGPAYTNLSASGTAQRAAYIDQHPKRNYVMQWNLNIQRSITSNTTGMIAYVGSRAVHNLMQTDDSSIVLPATKTPQGYLWPCTPSAFDPQCTAGGSLVNQGGTVTFVPNATLNPNFGRVPATLWNSDAVYHALQIQVQKRMSNGLSGQVSYTWGRTIDNASGSTDGDQFKNGLSSLFFFDSRVRRGPSDFNQTHNVVLSYTWDIPNPKAPSVLGWAASGWEFGGIFSANTGVPFTVTIAPDPLGMNSTDALSFPDKMRGCNPVHGGINYVNLNCFTLPAATPAIAAQCQPFGFVSAALGPPGNPGIPGTCANLLGNGGRNSITGPGLVNVDMSLFKNNYVRRVSEQFNVQFRMEIFNILNHANFNPPTSNSQIFNGDGSTAGLAPGLLDATSTTSRQVQFALKVIW
jgi:Carboxypeptidase regulatory-like domain/TonB dependent receptor/TonB-dependent Receptor Plug Domain